MNKEKYEKIQMEVVELKDDIIASSPNTQTSMDPPCTPVACEDTSNGCYPADCPLHGIGQN